MKAYYKTSDGKVVDLEQQVELWLYNKNIIQLIIPDRCEYIWADMKSVTELNKVEHLDLWI